MLAGKGMVLCNSAGNEASKTWKLISIPADADDVLTVGAVRSNGINTNFSSLGNSADGRIKPDVMAMGEACTVLSTRGELTTASGTSFASPIMCGMVACFWQANPKLTALEVVQKVRLLGDNVAHPDNVFGYGIPDFSKK
jgi:subtilisin family serine protease